MNNYHIFVNDGLIDDAMSQSLVSTLVRTSSQPTLTQSYITNCKWIEDSEVLLCMECNVTFGMWTRKHHCRLCGRLFCYKCASYTRTVPTTVAANNVINIKDKLIKYVYSRNQVRVCKKCAKIIDSHIDVNRIFMFLKYLSIKDILPLAKVCKSWNRSCTYYCTLLKDLKFKLLAEPLFEHEYDIIDCNLDLFSGHNKYLLQIFRMSGTNFMNKKIIKSITSKKQISCSKIYCDALCRPDLSVEQIIQIFHFCKPTDQLEEYLIKILGEKISDIEFECFIPILMNISQITNNVSKPMLKMLTDKYINNDKILGMIIWEMLRLEIKEVDDLEKNYPERSAIIKLIIESYKVYLNINNGENEKISLKELYFPGISDKFIKIDYKKIVKKISKTSPSVIPLIFQRRDTGVAYSKNILLKNDVIIKDYVICKIIKVLIFLLRRDNIIDVDIISYDIYPLNSKSGLIELVSDADTIYNILHVHKMTILNYILDNNPKETINVVRNRFINSLAAYSIITYLLGVGDRHLDNIMIHKTGYIFHIDFGFILGDDPKFSSTTMRISSDMVDAIGGKNGKDYILFKEKCSDIFNYLRRYIGIVITMLDTLIDSGVKIDKYKILNEIKNRFEPGERYLDAKTFIMTIVDNSRDNITQSFFDNIHKISKNFKFF
jgi:hypothetical protein